MAPTSDVYISATSDDPNVRAQEAIRSGNHRLLPALRVKIAC